MVNSCPPPSHWIKGRMCIVYRLYFLFFMCAVSCPTVRSLDSESLHSRQLCVIPLRSEESKGESIQTVVCHPFLEIVKIQRESVILSRYGMRSERESVSTPHVMYIQGVDSRQTQCMYGHFIQTHPSLQRGRNKRDGLSCTVYNSVQLQPFLPLWWVTESECHGRWVSSLSAEKFYDTHSLSYDWVCTVFSVRVWENRQMGVHSFQITLQNWTLQIACACMLNIKHTVLSLAYLNLFNRYSLLVYPSLCPQLKTTDVRFCSTLKNFRKFF